jgi:hypothetical protein
MIYEAQGYGCKLISLFGTNEQRAMDGILGVGYRNGSIDRRDTE